MTHRTRPKIPLPKQWPSRVRSGVLHAISLAQYSLTHTRSVAANSWNERIRLKQDNDRLRQELALLCEEMRIKDSRMLQIPAQRRPHYPPTERLSTLELRAARGWSLAQTARHLLVTTATVSSWLGRLDEEGPRAIVQTREPVNKFPDFVAYVVRRLKVLCPSMGRAKIAQVLGRAGLHIGPTTVRRLLVAKPRPKPTTNSNPSGRVVTAKRPNHVWHCDLTAVPTLAGLWASWLPFSVVQRWPFCWWVAVVVDHRSRRAMGVGIFESLPSSRAIRAFLGRAVRAAGKAPKHLITDHGVQFTGRGFRAWCGRRGIRQRFGAVGRYGSIAVVERFNRTMKAECTTRLLVPFRRDALRKELGLYMRWYNADRPHDTLDGCTPDEIYFKRRPACRKARFEPRPRWPRGSPCAGQPAVVRGRCGQRFELDVRFVAKRKVPAAGCAEARRVATEASLFLPGNTGTGLREPVSDGCFCVFRRASARVSRLRAGIRPLDQR